MLANLGRDFEADMRLGVELIDTVGPWIAILGSSKTAAKKPAYKRVYRCAQLVVQRLHLPVASGQSTGCMDAANKGALDAHGTSVGIYLQGLPTEQSANPWCTHSISCKTLLARQHLLLAGACGIVVSPEGGFGTVFEIGHQIIEMRRNQFDPNTPIVLMDSDGAWDGLREWLLTEVVARGFWSKAEFDKLYFCQDEDEAIAHLETVLARNALQASAVPARSGRCQPAVAAAGQRGRETTRRRRATA